MTTAAEIANFRPSFHRVRIDLGHHLTTNFADDDWERTDASRIACWQSARSMLDQREFNCGDCTVNLSVDWGPVIARLQNDFDVMQRLEKVKGTPEASEIAHQFSLASVEVTFLFQLNGDRLSKTPSLVAISEYFLHDFFLIVNLAAPGACNFYGTKIIQPEDRFAEQINLSNVLFESSILDARSDSWPKVGFLNLSEVIVWFYSIRSEMKLLPKNRMERVVFAMLHLCKAGISPTNVIWIFYGLETLFDTKIGENFRTLVSRIQLLLDLSEAEFKILKKKMRELYDIRSAFVHGGLEVIHPLQNEMLDKSVDEMTSRFIDTADFGFRILLASVQEIIRRGWREPNFREVLEGIAR